MTSHVLTGAPAQVFDVDLLLLHARRLSDQAGVVVGVPVGGAHWVLIVTAAVDVTDAPEESRDSVSGPVLFCLRRAARTRLCHSGAESLAEAHLQTSK